MASPQQLPSLRPRSYRTHLPSASAFTGNRRPMQSAPWITSSLAPPPPPDRSSTPTTPPVRLPPGIQSPLASDADDSLAGVGAVDCPMRLRIDDVFSCYREDDSDWFDAWRRQQCSPAIRELTLKAHLYPGHEPKPNHSLPAQRPDTQSALRPSRDNRRCSACHLNGPWHTVCVQEEAGLVTARSLPSITAPCSFTRTSLRLASRARRFRFPARTDVLRGPLRALS